MGNGKIQQQLLLLSSELDTTAAWILKLTALREETVRECMDFKKCLECLGNGNQD